MTALVEAGCDPALGWDELTPAQKEVWKKNSPVIMAYMRDNEPADLAQAEEQARRLN